MGYCSQNMNSKRQIQHFRACLSVVQTANKDHVEFYANSLLSWIQRAHSDTLKAGELHFKEAWIFFIKGSVVIQKRNQFVFHGRKCKTKTNACFLIMYLYVGIEVCCVSTNCSICQCVYESWVQLLPENGNYQHLWDGACWRSHLH